jgi:hypothetical protein
MVGQQSGQSSDYPRLSGVATGVPDEQLEGLDVDGMQAVGQDGIAGQGRGSPGLVEVDPMTELGVWVSMVEG